jgi:hypothetical protein
VSLRSRWQSSAARWRLGNGRVHASNAWHYAAGRHIQTAQARIHNWRTIRNIQRGRRDIVDRAADQVRARTPVLRDRIDRRTGRPNRTAASTGRQRDETLRWRQVNRAPMPRARTGRSR